MTQTPIQTQSPQSQSHNWMQQWRELVGTIQPDQTGWWNLGDALEPADWFAALAPRQKYELNQRRLQDWLYRRLISGVDSEASPDNCDRRFNGLDLDFALALDAHNHGTGYWDAGWRVVEATDHGDWFVQQQDLTIQVSPELHLQPDVQLTTGMNIAVKMPKNLVDADRYMAVGNAGKPVGDRLQLYLHCDRDGILAVMGRITQTFNDLGIPFTFAVPYEPFEYPRQDAGILILERSAQTQVKSDWPMWTAYLRPGEPLLGKPVCPGLASVQLDADTTNFGWSRCQLFAQGLLDQPQTRRSRLRGVEQAFAQAKLNLTKPYLSAGAMDWL
ncbi:hypothetical protein IQ266_15050 [filamentous cyanobacterium LEGE 11480]|uniref:Uncharacterized protein n=1 Tax=Romeriopsis navalis LEGE 11480 TaxID=2777977 RepID=A0A928VMI3_9CYAN|nr:T3SS effector HopA1 family protein [Romeriopsis navalis]MBE9031050.1 hypothetical protein [Romeriopsis navalis LEGE 11480]